jgi:LPS sulfotransferase NodH
MLTSPQVENTKNPNNLVKIEDLIKFLRLAEHEVSEECARLQTYFNDYAAAYSSSDHAGLTRYVLATTSRVGGHFIGQILGALGVGQPHEFFSNYHLEKYATESTLEKGKLSLAEYWFNLFSEAYKEHGPNGSFGVKVPFNFLLPFIKNGNFPFGFKKWNWIYLYRRDVIAQGLSLYIAEKARSWNSFEGQERINNLRISDCNIHQALNAIQIIVNERLRWELFFSLFGIPHLALAYEDMLEDVVRESSKIRQFLGLNNNSLKFKEIDPLMKQEAPIYGELREKITKELLGNFTFEHNDLLESCAKNREILELQSKLALQSAENAKLKFRLVKLGQEI